MRHESCLPQEVLERIFQTTYWVSTLPKKYILVGEKVAVCDLGIPYYDHTVHDSDMDGDSSSERLALNPPRRRR